MTAVAFTPLSASDFNLHVRDNLAYLKDAVESREPGESYVSSTVSTTSDDFVTLTGGPEVSITTGTAALVSYSAKAWHNNWPAGGAVHMAFKVSGATTMAAASRTASTLQGLRGDNNQATLSWSGLVVGLTPGTNVFTSAYAESGGTASFSTRQLTVVPL